MTLTKTLLKVILGVCLLCLFCGVLLYFRGYKDAGLILVVAGYGLYIALRLVARRARTGDVREEPGRQEAEEGPLPDSWDAMRAKAVEALNRKLRGQGIKVDSFFRPAHREFGALARVHADLCGGAGALVLKMDHEVLKLRRGPQETASILEKISGLVSSEDELHREIEKLRTT